MKEQARPNIVLICVDQWRGDCISSAGHPVVHTPFLDQMAMEGVSFNRCYSATPTCIAARAALHTGLTARTHGRVGYEDRVAWKYPVTMAGEFTRHGYQTQAIGKMHVFPWRNRIGFQDVVLHDGHLHSMRKMERNLDKADDYLPWLRKQLGREADYFDHGLNCNAIPARPWDKPEYVHPTNYIVTQAIDFVKKRKTSKPLFLYLSFHRPHPPYDPPDWAFEQYLYRDMPPPPVGNWTGVYEGEDQPWRPDLFRGKVDPHVLQRARAGYYGSMTHICHQLNRFAETLEDLGQTDNTWFCFVSDHGEMMGDHHLFRKGFPYEGSARVPLLLKGPWGQQKVKRGSVVSRPVELRDVMPSLLELAGLPIPKEVEGKSFLGLAAGKTQPWREVLFGEHVLFGQDIHWGTDEREKYVWLSKTGTEQLFDLKKDPLELVDLAKAGGSKSRVARWRGLLAEELKGREEGFSDGKRLFAGRPVSATLSHIR